MYVKQNIWQLWYLKLKLLPALMTAASETSAGALISPQLEFESLSVCSIPLLLSQYWRILQKKNHIYF